MSLRTIPEELKKYDNWTGWKGEDRKPLNLETGGNAQSDNPATWAPFSVAEEKLYGWECLFDGVGFVVPKGFVGFDFDGVIVEGKVEPFVLDILKALQNPYCELSPSGFGLRTFVKYDGPALPKQMVAKDKSKGKYGVEVFSGSHTHKVLTVTGERYSGEGIPTMDTLDHVYFLCSQLTNYKFKKLWEGDISDYNDDQSSADLALMVMLARLTKNDAKLMEFYFESSALGQRDKWNARSDYRDRTIAKAMTLTAAKEDNHKPTEIRKFDHPILLAARESAKKFDMDSIVFDPAVSQREHTYVMEGFITEGDSALVIGAKKAEKSLFGERIAMHIACGKSWCGFNCPNPRRVAYLDGENDPQDVSDRWHSLLQEFTPEQQQLIRENLVMVLGRPYTDEGGTLDYLNDAWWDKYAEKTRDCEVHFLDCLYLFHEKESYDNNGLREVMDVLRYRINSMGSNRTLVMLHHSRSLSNDDLKSVDRLSLERLGPMNFSEQSFGGKVLLKNATLVVCLDRRVKRDEDDEIESEGIHFQFYGRRVPESPLLKFENADDKYARTLNRDLTKGSRRAAMDLRMVAGENGSWSTKHEAAKCLKGARSNSYRHLSELQAKGYLIPMDGRLHLRLSNELVQTIQHDVKKNEAYERAKKWLLSYVTHPMKAENVIDAGDEAGYTREDLIRGRAEVGLVEEERLDASMVCGELIWRPKKKRGLRKGSEQARLASQKGVEARGCLPKA